MPDYIVDPLAENDLRQIWKYIAKDNPAAANHLIEAALESFTMLAATPNMGKRPSFLNSPGENNRTWNISDFPKYVIFYRVRPEGIQIRRVYHSARNLDAFFEPPKK